MTHFDVWDETEETRLSQIKEKSTKTIIVGDVNTQNIGIQNIQNNIQNNIKIYAYGKEDLSHILEKDFKNILNKGFKSVPNLVEYIHSNKNKPENHNIYISAT